MLEQQNDKPQLETQLEKESIAANRRIFLDSCRFVKEKVTSDPDHITRPGRQEAASTWASYQEVLSLLEETIEKRDDVDTVFLSAFTRCGKSVSGVILSKAIQEMSGDRAAARVFDIQRFTSLSEARFTPDIFEEGIKMFVKRGIPKVLIIDEINILRLADEDGTMLTECLAILRKYMPDTFFVCLNVISRNRGKAISADYGKTPDEIHQPLAELLEEKGYNVEFVTGRDGWHLSSVKRILRVFSNKETSWHEKEFSQLAFYMIVFTYGNPHFLKGVIHQLNDGQPLTDQHLEFLMQVSKRAVHELATDPEKIYSEEFFEGLQLSGHGATAKLFDEAFGGWGKQIWQLKYTAMQARMAEVIMAQEETFKWDELEFGTSIWNDD